tara:strand:- start:14249 stop:17080 length:2832 start_codon:yes stop_codon:yes gene_type:complete
MAYIGRQLARGENRLFDDISGSFNGSTTTFNLTISSVATSTATPFQLFVSLGGVMQKPNTDFTTAGNQITFTTAPAAGLSCWIMMQGDTIDSAAISDASVTPSKISGSGDFAFPADIRLKDADGSHYLGFQAPSTVSNNVVWTLPATDTSVSGYVLASDGSGNLSWVQAGNNSSPSFTGDVTLTNDGSIVGFSSLHGTYTGSVKTYTVIVASKTAAHRYNGQGSGLGYKINGKEAPFLTLTPGRTYKFDQSDGSNSGHPFRFYLEADKTTAYTTGVTTNGTPGSSGAYTQIVVSDTTPQVLHYQCSAHGYMGNAVQTNSNVSSGAVTNLTVSSNAVITGDLTVNGTTTTINTQTLDVEDKNIVIGKVSSPSDTTADGGGITLKGSSDHTFNWVNATDAWTSSEHLHLIDSKKLFVGGASGTTDGLEIVHDGSNSILNDSGTGTLQLQTGGSTKLEIQSGGINVTGAINVNGAALSTAPTITATASGSISANAPVIINSSGQVKAITQTSASLGSVDDIDTSSNAYFYGGTSPISYDASQDLLIAGVRYSTTIYIYGGTVSGTDTSWQTSGASSTGSNRYYPVIASDGNGYALLVYKNSQCHGRIIRFQGTSQTMGSETQIQDNSSQCEVPAVLHLEGAYFAAVYNDENPSPDEGRCRICQRGSGTSTSFTMGSVTAFSGGGEADDPYNFALAKISGTKFVILWSSGTNNAVYAKIGTRSGTSVSFGTRSTVVSGTHGEQPTIAYDSLNDQLVAVYRNYLKIGTISGTTISWGSAIQFSSNNTLYHAAEFSDSGQLLIGYKDAANAGKYRTATYNAAKTDFTFDSEAYFSTGITNLVHFSRMESGKVAIMYQNGSASQKAQTRIRQMASTDLNQDNFIGFSSAGYTNGQTATINVVGNTTTQSGLTPGEKYFVQDNATLGTSKDTFDVIAGKALTSTSLLITPA